MSRCTTLVTLLGLTLALALTAAVGPWQSLAASSRPTAHRAPVNPADVAATHAYLTAVYAYAQAEAANAAASKAAFTAAANTLESECAGALKGAPVPRFGAGREDTPLIGRAAGEASRRLWQLHELERELFDTPVLASEQPDRQAAAALVGAVASLSWSSPKITQLAHRFANERVQALEPEPAACADIRAWVASGYERLNPSTKQFRSALRSRPPGIAGAVLDKLLSAYEGPAEKLIIRQTERTEDQTGSPLESLVSTFGQLLHALDAPSDPFEKLENTKSHRVTIGHGRTATGEGYTVAVETTESSGSGGGKMCQVQVTAIRSNGLIVGSFGGFGLRAGCSNPGSQAEPSVNCDEGQLTIHARTLPHTRRVVLRLSNGRTISSRPVLLPRREDGPAGVYYQIVHGPSPIPVSLTEFDAHGRRLRSEMLSRVVECTKHPFRYLPGGLRTLVRDSVPQGPAFALAGEHYRFLGHTYFRITLQMKPSASEEENSSGGEDLLFVGVGGLPVAHRPDPFSRQQQTGCRPPHPYAILYGLLKRPGSSVLVRFGGKLQTLRRVRIPKSMHARGVLVYGVLPAMPEEVIIRSARGKTIFTESLGSLGRELTETCEGEAEGG